MLPGLLCPPFVRWSTFELMSTLLVLEWSLFPQNQQKTSQVYLSVTSRLYPTVLHSRQPLDAFHIVYIAGCPGYRFCASLRNLFLLISLLFYSCQHSSFQDRSQVLKICTWNRSSFWKWWTSQNDPLFLLPIHSLFRIVLAFSINFKAIFRMQNIYYYNPVCYKRDCSVGRIKRDAPSFCSRP